MPEVLELYFDVLINTENAEKPITFIVKDAAVSLSASEAAELFKQLYAYQDYFYGARIKALRMAGRKDEAISLLRRTDIGNTLYYRDEEGPTQRDLFHSFFLHECSEEWLAEQLDIPLAKVKEIWEVWNDDFQERTPETAQKLEEALLAVGCLPEEKEEPQEQEEGHSELIERFKLWGIEHVPLQGSAHLVKMTDDREVHRKRKPLTIEDEGGKHLEDLVFEVDVLGKGIKALGDNSASIGWSDDGTLYSFDAEGDPGFYWAEHHTDSRESYTSLARFFIQLWKDSVASHGFDYEKHLLSKPCWAVIEDKK